MPPLYRAGYLGDTGKVLKSWRHNSRKPPKIFPLFRFAYLLNSASKIFLKGLGLLSLPKLFKLTANVCLPLSVPPANVENPRMPPVCPHTDTPFGSFVSKIPRPYLSIPPFPTGTVVSICFSGCSFSNLPPSKEEKNLFKSSAVEIISPAELHALGL